MARARFRFDRILRLKAQLRKAAQDEIAMLRQELANVESGIAGAAAARVRNRAHATDAALQDRVTARDLQLYEVYDRAQTLSAQALRVRADALGTLIETKLPGLLDQRREERQFEELEGRQRAREALDDVRTEANFQDDLARRR
jgi:flagellar export protein FliJ